jgi:NhaP-type Na+/H+ or K+/H+ antiporter
MRPPRRGKATELEHGLNTEFIAVFAGSIVLWSIFSAWLGRFSITPALTFVALGLVVSNPPLQWLDINPSSTAVRSFAEITLAVVLFVDAARIDYRRLKGLATTPLRLLFIGLPLSVVVGYACAWLTVPSVTVSLALVIASATAPTDAALGAPLMADERVPTFVRQSLNVESGLNDGLITPVVSLAIAAAAGGFETHSSGGASGAVVDLITGLGVGVATGVIGAVVIAWARRHHLMGRNVEAMAVLGLALFSYSATVEASGNGFVAAFVAGLAFGAVRRAMPEVLEFAALAGDLLGLGVWFVVGAMAIHVLEKAPLSVVAFAVLSLTVVRMVPVAVALIGGGLHRVTVLFMGWFGPRGLASVVFALLAFDSLTPGKQRDNVLAAITVTVLLSVLLHGLTARPLAGHYAAVLDEGTAERRAKGVPSLATRRTLGSGPGLNVPGGPPSSPHDT